VEGKFLIKTEQTIININHFFNYRKGQERLDWMYAAGPNQSSSAKAQEMEDFLLGKKRVDSLIEQGTSIDKVYLVIFQFCLNSYILNATY
jgi:hypothetical protein